MHVMGWTEKSGTTSCGCLIPGSFPSNARHWLLHLKALGPCSFPGGAMGSGKQQGPSVGGQPQQLFLYTNPSHASALQISLVSHTKLFKGRSHMLIESLEKWSLGLCLHLCGPCKRNANRVLLQDQVGFRTWEKPVTHRKG